jgi:hypothetical protein
MLSWRIESMACHSLQQSQCFCLQIDALLQKLGSSGLQAALRLHDYSKVDYGLLLYILQAFDDRTISSIQHTGLQQPAPVVPGAANSSYLQGLSTAGKLNAVSTVYHALQPCGIEVIAASAAAMATLKALQKLNFQSMKDRRALLAFLEQYKLSYYISEELRAAFLSESTLLSDIFVALGHCASEGLREF